MNEKYRVYYTFVFIWISTFGKWYGIKHNPTTTLLIACFQMKDIQLNAPLYLYD